MKNIYFYLPNSLCKTSYIIIHQDITAYLFKMLKFIIFQTNDFYITRSKLLIVIGALYNFISLYKQRLSSGRQHINITDSNLDE